MTIRILLADDHQLLREGLAALFDNGDSYEIVGEAANGVDAVELCKQVDPDLVLMDISMPKMSGIEAARALQKNQSKAKIIMLSMHAQKHLILQAIQAGASGYLVKDRTFDEVHDAIADVMAGQTYVSPSLAQVMISEHIQPENVAPVHILTGREKQVLKMIADGRKSKQMADELGVSIKTIEAHRSNIMKKLNLNSIAKLTKYAIKNGLTSTDI